MRDAIRARARRAPGYLAVAAAVVATAALTWPATALAALTATVAPTATTLAVSSSTTSYGATAGFTAAVTSADGTPSGLVTFVDTSNGSSLGSAVLAGGTASFSTAALAPGQRDVVAEYDGSPSFAASRSAPAVIYVGGTDDALDAQIGPAHAGYQAASALSVKDLVKKWSVLFSGLNGAVLSYPIIAAGRIFTSSSPDAGTASAKSIIYALSQRTGKLEWTAKAASESELPSLSYDGRTLFSVGTGGMLSAFDAATGHRQWARQLPGQYAFSSAPTAYDGVVYVAGSGTGGTLYAVREADGKLLWSRPVSDGDDSSPAVAGDAVYLSYACQEDYRFSMAGSLVWNYNTGCNGGGGGTPAVYGGLVYAEGNAQLGDVPVILSARTGKAASGFDASSIPAFDTVNMYVLDSGNLIATDPFGRPQRWVFGGGAIQTPAVADRGDVFVGAADGTVYGLTPSGHEAWSAVAGSATVSDPYSGLAIGDGLLVVAADNVLTAFGD